MSECICWHFLSYYDCDLAFFNTSTLPKHQPISHSSPGVFSDVGVVLCNSHFPEEKAVIVLNFPLLQKCPPVSVCPPFLGGFQEEQSPSSFVLQHQLNLLTTVLTMERDFPLGKVSAPAFLGLEAEWRRPRLWAVRTGERGCLSGLLGQYRKDFPKSPPTLLKITQTLLWVQVSQTLERMTQVLDI